jgi:chorismate mutase
MSTNLQIESITGDSDFPLIIAGPCSAESLEQVVETGKAVAACGRVSYYRAGIWKPRTRPDGFEGVGEKGLEWLNVMKRETGLKTAVEVASPAHLEAALKAGIDMVWLGARTSANPFSVQEIAGTLKGVDIPVMVKNPLHPDLKLWIGALERIHGAGIKKIVAVHRGFYTYDNGPYRNLPMWEIPIELKRLIPELPVINDPSHISGKRNLVFETAQKALDLAMDGLMIETHISPDNAKTDANQQLTPLQLCDLLSQLVLRKEYGTADFEIVLEKIRKEVDDIDSELLQILFRRMEKIREIGLIKKENNITVLQIDRLRKMMKSRLKTGKELGLDSKFVLKLLQLVHKESIQLQTGIMNKKDTGI